VIGLAAAIVLGLLLALGLMRLFPAITGGRGTRNANALAEQRARSILMSAHDAFVSIDPAGVVTDWNPRAQQLFGWSPRQAIGRPLHELIIPQTQRAAHTAALARLASGGPPHLLGRRLEMIARHQDGHEVPVELEIWQLGTGPSVSFHAFLRDIAERRQVDADLVEARDQALESSKATARFLATMSHEIRTPMNGVLGLTDLLLDTLLDETQRHYAEGIRNAGKVLLSVINDILDFSKLEAGKVELEQIAFDPARLLREVAEVFAATTAEKGLELTVECDEALPPAVIGDPARLRQVLLNLTSNAVKFTHEGGVALTATVDHGVLSDDAP
jgi:PAS domain S-box-containing protein